MTSIPDRYPNFLCQRTHNERRRLASVPDDFDVSMFFGHEELDVFEVDVSLHAKVVNIHADTDDECWPEDEEE